MYSLAVETGAKVTFWVVLQLRQENIFSDIFGEVFLQYAQV